jgi:hypothetical protein
MTINHLPGQQQGEVEQEEEGLVGFDLVLGFDFVQAGVVGFVRAGPRAE